MLKIGLIARPNAGIWGGDFQALAQLKEGLTQLGQKVVMGESAYDVIEADVAILSNTTIDQRENMDVLLRNQIPYLYLCIHEDAIQYYPASQGLAYYIRKCVEGESERGISFTLERLWDNPEVIFYFSVPAFRDAYFNVDVMKHARYCVANSETEARTIRRDCPVARTALVRSSGHLWTDAEGDDGFFEELGLERGGYLLQVGRLETRKNQLATLLATRDVEMPLVLVATQGPQSWYEQLCVEVALKYRRGPTLIVSQNMASMEKGTVRVVQMPGGKKMPSGFMQKVFKHARLYVHPAFYELPGFVFFEALRYGVPMIASEWCTIRDYFTGVGEDVRYVLPYDLPALERAVKQMLGKGRQEKGELELCLQRTQLDFANDFLTLIRQC